MGPVGLQRLSAILGSGCNGPDSHLAAFPCVSSDPLLAMPRVLPLCLQAIPRAVLCKPSPGYGHCARPLHDNLLHPARHVPRQHCNAARLLLCMSTHSTAAIGGEAPQLMKSFAVQWQQAGAWAQGLLALCLRQSWTAHRWPSNCLLGLTTTLETSHNTC